MPTERQARWNRSQYTRGFQGYFAYPMPGVQFPAGSTRPARTNCWTTGWFPVQRPSRRRLARPDASLRFSRALLWNLGAFLSRFRKSDRNSLFSAFDLFAGSSALERAGLALLHGAANFLRRTLGVFPLLCLFGHCIDPPEFTDANWNSGFEQRFIFL